MPNLATRLSNLNKAKLKQSQPAPPPTTCTCTKEPCPVPGSWKKSDVIYTAKVNTSDGQPSEFYTGMSAYPFMVRLGNHKQSFIKRNLEHKSTLSTFIWKLKDKGIDYNIEWDIINSARSYKPGDRFCGLCIAEAKAILFRPEAATLNKRDEVFNTCRHKAKFKLARAWQRIRKEGIKYLQFSF